MAEIGLTILVLAICWVVLRSMADGYLPTPRWVRWLRVVVLGGSRLHNPDTCPACLEQAAVDQNVAEAERVTAEKAKLEPATPAQEPTPGAWEQPPVDTLAELRVATQNAGITTSEAADRIRAALEEAKADNHFAGRVRAIFEQPPLAEQCDHEWVDDTRISDSSMRLTCHICGTQRFEARGNMYHATDAWGRPLELGQSAPPPPDQPYANLLEFGTGTKRVPPNPPRYDRYRR